VSRWGGEGKDGEKKRLFFVSQAWALLFRLAPDLFSSRLVEGDIIFTTREQQGPI
jgi:hypothetical protein